MHWRHAAQRGKAQVQRLAGAWVGSGQQRRGLVVGILDHADAVDSVQLARLARYVRSGETQAQVARVARVGHLGQHLAVAFGIEAIGLDPAKAGDALELQHCLLQQFLEAAGLVQAAHEAAHQRVVVALPDKIGRQARGSNSAISTWS